MIGVTGLYLRLKGFEEYGGPDLTVGLHVVRVVAAPKQPVRDAHQIRLHFLREVFDVLRLLVWQFVVDREEVEQQHGGHRLTVPTQRVLELSLQRVLAGLVKCCLKQLNSTMAYSPIWRQIRVRIPK